MEDFANVFICGTVVWEPKAFSKQDDPNTVSVVRFAIQTERQYVNKKTGQQSEYIDTYDVAVFKKTLFKKAMKVEVGDRMVVKGSLTVDKKAKGTNERPINKPIIRAKLFYKLAEDDEDYQQ